MDNKDLRAFDQKIHDKLHRVEGNAPFDMWSKISEQLDVQEAAAPKVSIRPAQKQSFNWKYAAAAAVIAFTFVSSYLSFSGSEADSVQYSSNTASYEPGINFANSEDEAKQITVEVQEPKAVLAVIKETPKKQPKKIAVPVENNTVAEEAAVAVNEEYTPAETTNIPMFSLRMATPQTSLNDQITILSGNDKKVEEEQIDATKDMSIKRRIEFYKKMAKFNSWK